LTRLCRLIIIVEVRNATCILSKTSEKDRNRDLLKLVRVNRYEYGAGDRVNDF